MWTLRDTSFCISTRRLQQGPPMLLFSINCAKIECASNANIWVFSFSYMVFQWAAENIISYSMTVIGHEHPIFYRLLFFHFPLSSNIQYNKCICGISIDVGGNELCVFKKTRMNLTNSDDMHSFIHSFIVAWEIIFRQNQIYLCWSFHFPSFWWNEKYPSTNVLSSSDSNRTVSKYFYRKTLPWMSAPSTRAEMAFIHIYMIDWRSRTQFSETRKANAWSLFVVIHLWRLATKLVWIVSDVSVVVWYYCCFICWCLIGNSVVPERMIYSYLEFVLVEDNGNGGWHCVAPTIKSSCFSPPVIVVLVPSTLPNCNYNWLWGVCSLNFLVVAAFTSYRTWLIHKVVLFHGRMFGAAMVIICPHWV